MHLKFSALLMLLDMSEASVPFINEYGMHTCESDVIMSTFGLETLHIANTLGAATVTESRTCYYFDVADARRVRARGIR